MKLLDPDAALEALASRLFGVQRWQELKTRAGSSPHLLLFVVFCAYLLDNILLTVVVPILPKYLFLREFPQCRDVARLAECDLPKPYISEDIINHNNRIGVLFSSKAVVQLAVSPAIGALTRRYGHSWPMFIGLAILLVSSAIFAIGSSYPLMLFARSLHGVGSSCICIAGMGIVAETFDDERTRSRSMGRVLGGMALGVLVGYPLGGILYDFIGKAAPFCVVATAVMANVMLQALVVGASRLHNSGEAERSVEVAAAPSEPLLPMRTLLADPHVIVTAVVICVTTMAMAVLEPCLPIWLMDTINPPEWQIGTVFIPDSIGYYIGCNHFGVFALSHGRWRCALLAMVGIGVCSCLIPMATAMVHLIMPHFGLGLGLGVVDASLMPLLAQLVDTRHEGAVYGSVFAIGQTAVCLAYSIGPLLGGAISSHIGFGALMRLLGVINLVLAPICFLLRETKADVNQAKPLINRTRLVASGGNLHNFGVGGQWSKLEEDEFFD